MGRRAVIRSEVEKQKMKVESRKRHQHDLRRAMAVSDYLLLTATDLHRQATAFVDKLEEKYPGKRDVRKTVEFRNWQQKQLLLFNKQSSLATDQTPAMNCEKETALQIPQDTTICVKETALQIPQDITICEKETALQIPKDNINREKLRTPQDSTNCQKEMVLRIPLIHTGTKAKETPSVPDMPGETQEDQLTSIFDEIPNDVMNELIAEICADPDLSTIMDDFGLHEEVLDEGTVPENIYQEMDIGLDIEIDDPLEDEINSLLYF